MATWLLRCSETRWHMRDFFTGGHTETGWPIQQHWKHMAAGDGIAVWRSGTDGGVVALGQVTGAPRRGVPDPDFWTGDAGEQWLAPIAFTAHFADQPIARDTLAADPRFENALILRMSGGRNPFPLTDDEWATVTERVPPSGPVAAAVRGAAVVVAVGATAVREAFKSAVRSG